MQFGSGVGVLPCALTIDYLIAFCKEESRKMSGHVVFELACFWGNCGTFDCACFLDVVR